ncbi:hypothetical protein [Roseobacter ponti]|nr:hypothetical protein [Roseobacter ponti]
MVFFTGLPASGKSFLMREQISMAASAGRRVRIIRWDAGLAAFERDSILARYPDVADGSHPIIRKAAGLWARQALARWLSENRDPAEMLIGEVPIIGSRYSEFVQVIPDAAEPALASDTTVFFYPVPTGELREKLEAIRKATFANPQHPDEARDAPPEIMNLAWRLTREKAIELGLVTARAVGDQSSYDETTYRRFFDHLLRHRNARAIDIDTLYSVSGTAHDLEAGISELIATPGEVENAIADVELALTAGKVVREVENWYLV